jgi:hypothetical protein
MLKSTYERWNAALSKNESDADALKITELLKNYKIIEDIPAKAK